MLRRKQNLQVQANVQYLNIDRVIVISMAFFIMFTSYWTCQSIAPVIMKELGYGNIGFINLAVIYGSFGFFSLFSVPVNRKLGHKMSMFLSSSMYALWAFVFMIPAYIYQNKDSLTKEQLESGWLSKTSIISFSLGSAFLVGLGAGPLWVGMNCYMAECSSHWNKGRYMSLFFGLFQLSSIFGNIIAGVLIDKVAKTTFYLIMGIIGLTGSFAFLLLKNPVVLTQPNNQDDLSKVSFELKIIANDAPENESCAKPIKGKSVDIGISRDSSVSSAQLKLSETQSIKPEDAKISDSQNESQKESLLDPIKFLADKRMHSLAPIVFFRAMQLASQASVFISFWVLLITETEGPNGIKLNQNMTEDEKIGIALRTYVALGLGMVFGPQIMGFLLDKFGHKAAIMYILACTVASCLLLIIQNEMQQFVNYLAILTMFLLGIVDNCLLSYITMIFGMEFESAIVPSASRQSLEGTSVFVFIMCLGIWTLETKANFRAYFTFMLILGVFSLLLINKVSSKFKKNNKVEAQNIMQ